jgi:hypothetical protein
MSDVSGNAPVIDAVLSYHLNAHTCGVARFNTRLADALGVPMVGLDVEGTFRSPLLSIKTGEMDRDGLERLNTYLGKRFGLVLHGFDGSDLEVALIKSAEFVMVLNAEMLEAVQPIRPDCLLGFAPGIVPDKQDEDVDVTLVTFGMAHKINAPGYRAVAELIAGDARSFRLEISSALHEGTRFDDRFFDVKDEISEVFSGNVRFLGFLADGEVGRRLLLSDAMLAFFPRGVRENNTSVLGAMAHGLAVVTNLDEFSPSWMSHGKTVFDVRQLTTFPSGDELTRVGRAGMDAVAALTYDTLSARLRSGSTAFGSDRLGDLPS